MNFIGALGFIINTFSLDSVSPYNYFLYLFKLANLNTLLYVLNINNKVIGDS